MSYTIENPKPLETEFMRRSWKQKQEKRVGKIALFSVTNEDGKVIQWEVIVVNVNKGGKLFDNVVDPYERYPSDGDFGRIGWSYQHRVDADKKFEELLKSANNPS